MEMRSFIHTVKEYGDHFHNPITIADCSLPDTPLIYVNDKFLELTGYDQDEVLGRNCRFLQGEKTNRSDARILREGIEEMRPVCQDLINYKKDDTLFYNRILLLPIQNSHSYIVGLQNEISEAQFKNFTRNDEMYLLDSGINALTALYSSILVMEKSRNYDLTLLNGTFDRIRKLVLNL